MDPTNQQNNEQVLYDSTENQDLTPPASNFPLKKIAIIAAGVLIFFIVLVIAFMLVTRPSKNGPVTLHYWGLWEESPTFKQVIDTYQQKHPNVKIVYEKQDIKSRPEGYVNFLISRIRSGTGPDIFRFHNSWLTQLHDYLLPVPDSVLSSIQFRQQYYQSIQNDMTWNKAVYGVPLYVDTLSLFVNNDLLKAGGYQVPSDWDSMLDTVRNLTVLDPTTKQIQTSGIALGTYDNIDHASDIVGLLFAQSGVSVEDLLSSDANTAKNARDKAIKALHFYTCFALTSDECQKVWDQNMPESKLAFAQGKLAMYFGYSWDVLDIRNANPNLNFSVHPVPHLPGDKQTVASYWAEGVSLNTKSSKEAFDFLSYLNSKDALTSIYAEQAKERGMGTAYPRKDMQPLLQTDPYLSTFANQADNASSTLFSSNTYDGAIDTWFDEALQQAVNSVVNSGNSPDSAIDTMISNLKQKISGGANGK